MRKLLCTPWQTLSIPFALTPIGQLHQFDLVSYFEYGLGLLEVGNTIFDQRTSPRPATYAAWHNYYYRAKCGWQQVPLALCALLILFVVSSGDIFDVDPQTGRKRICFPHPNHC